MASSFSAMLLLGMCLTIVSAQEYTIKVNFQPRYVDPPDGFLVDYGLKFGKRENGRMYGWNNDHTIATGHDQTRTRSECSYFPDMDVQDCTLMVMDRHNRLPGDGGLSTWSMEVVPGNYAVTLHYSDPQNVGRYSGCKINDQDAGLSDNNGFCPKGSKCTRTVNVKADNSNQNYPNRIYFSGQWMGTSPDSCAAISYITIVRSDPWPPTSSPSLAPTGWFQAPGHPENITQLQSHVVELFNEVSSLKSTIVKNKVLAAEDLSTQRDAIQTTVLYENSNLRQDLASLQMNMSTLQSQLSTEVSSRMSLADSFSQTRQAILDVVQAIPAVIRTNPLSSNNAPELDADGTLLKLSATGGSVSIETSVCSAFDPCDIIGALNSLKNV